MGARFVPNMEFFNRLNAASEIAVEQAAEALHTDLVQSQTIPFDVGTLQNVNTFVAPVVEGKTRIITQGPQARRLYFHPEYNFQKIKNPNAGGRWLDPYLPGHAKQDVFRAAYAQALKRQMGG